MDILYDTDICIYIYYTHIRIEHNKIVNVLNVVNVFVNMCVRQRLINANTHGFPKVLKIC